MEAYFDNSATTIVTDSVKDIVVKTMTEDFGNPSAMHMVGVKAEKYIKEAQENIAKILKVDPKEIFFTSGGTESNNMAIIGTAMANKRKGMHCIVSSVEHSSVKEPFNFLEKEGFRITYLPVDKDGIVVESSTDVYENVPEIDGLKFDSIVINNKLDVGNSEIYNTILDLTQSFDKYDINVDKVYFDSSYNITLYMGDVKVSLGNSKDFTDRLFELKQLSARFGTLKGTLYLDEYNGDESSIIFKREK